ncbi:MAG: sulfatase family protein [Verrucomicrobiaceae bacterium]|nr:sulfatase family protein [Verrucomicrobiaceae bacterium]
MMMAVLLLSLPNLLTAFYPRVDPTQAESFWLGIGLILLPAVFGLAVRPTLLLWLPLVALMPATMLYTLYTGSPLREWAFVVLMETDAKELARFWSAAVAALVLAPLVVWLVWWFIHRHIGKGHRLGWLTRVVVIIFALVIPAANIKDSGWEFGTLATQRKLSATYPIGPVVAAAAAFQIRHNLEARGSIAQDIAVTPSAVKQREIYVLVIGESARAGSFQLNGYERETTPLLAKTDGILSFKDVSAPATVTLMSVPLLLTPARAPWLGKAAGMPSVVSIFKQAGFHTAWLSTQRKHGRYDTSCSIYANDAHESRFLSGSFAPGVGTYESAFDGELVAPVCELISHHDPKLLIVLHTMGSHQHYGERVPPGFNPFNSYPARCEPDPMTGKYSAEQVRNLTNAYDNSIRYTDEVLSRLIGALAATHAVSVLFYISDHGQNKGDAKVLPFAHGSMTRDVVQLPMILWLSPEYRVHYPDKAAALSSHLATPFSADTTFHTLTDMAGLDCPLLNRQRSVASAGFQPGKRLLRNLDGVVVDYDEALARAAKKQP